MLAYLGQILKQRLLKNSFIYISLGLLKSAIPLLLLPVLTRYLSPADYGILVTYEILLSIFIVLISLNVPSAVSVVFFKLDREQLKIYIGSSFLLVLISFGAVLLISFILREYIFQWTQLSIGWLFFIGITALLNIPIMLLLIIWQVNERPWPFGFLNILIVLFNILLSVYFVVYLDWHWQGRIWGVALSTLILAVASCVILYRQDYFHLSWHKNYFRDILSYGCPLMLHMVCGWILIATDRLMLNSMVGFEVSGLYTVSYQITSVITLIMQLFNQAWSPFLFRKLKQNDGETKWKIVKLTYVMLFGCLLFSLLLNGLAPYFLNIFVGNNFYAAVRYVSWLSLANAASGMYYVVVGYIFYMQKTNLIAMTTCVSAVINIILNYVMIQRFGGVGAAQATAMTSFFNFILVWIVAARVYPMPWLSLKLRIR